MMDHLEEEGELGEHDRKSDKIKGKSVVKYCCVVKDGVPRKIERGEPSAGGSKGSKDESERGKDCRTLFTSWENRVARIPSAFPLTVLKKVRMTLGQSGKYV